MTAIRSCTCKHEFQDKTYGHGQRVFNTTKDSGRCTVCAKNTAGAQWRSKVQKIADEFERLAPDMKMRLTGKAR